MDDVVIDKDIIEISNYLQSYYFRQFNKEMSEIKKHKSLYFLFVFGIEKYNEMKHSEIKNEYTNFTTKLFNVTFQAGGYGPVVEEIYDNRDFNQGMDDKYDDLEDLTNDKIILDFIISNLEEISKANDFDVINRSKQDGAFKKAYALGYKTIINFEDLLIEYTEDEN